MPRKTWSQKDERKYKAIVKSCKLSSGAKKKGAAKECQRIAAATVERDRGVRGLRGGVPPIPGLFAPPLRGSNRPLPRVGRGRASQAQHDADRAGYEQRLAEWNRRTMRSPNADPELLQRQASEEDPLVEAWDALDYEQEVADHPGDRMRGLGAQLLAVNLEGTAAEHARRAREYLSDASLTPPVSPTSRAIGLDYAARAYENAKWAGDSGLTARAGASLKRAFDAASACAGMRGLGDPRTAARVRPAFLNVVADAGNRWAENKIVAAQDSPEEPWWLNDEDEEDDELLESHFPEITERLSRFERLDADEESGLRREGARRYTSAVNQAMERWRSTGAMPTTEPVREPRGFWDAVIYERPVRGLRSWDEDRSYTRERDRSRAGLDDPDEPELDPDEPPPRWGAKIIAPGAWTPRPSARAWPRALPAGATLLVDDEHESSLEDFLEANREGLDPSEAHRVARLSPGQTHQGGGGAAADWKVKRLRGRASAPMLEVTGDLLRGEDWESPISTAHFLQREGEDLEPEVAARISNLKVGETYAQGFDWRVKRIRGGRR